VNGGTAKPAATATGPSNNPTVNGTSTMPPHTMPTMPTQTATATSTTTLQVYNTPKSRPKERTDSTNHIISATVEQKSKESRRADTANIRNHKREQRINQRRFHIEPAVGAASEAAVDPVMKEGDGKEVVDSNGQPVRESQVREMISRYADSHSQTYENAYEYLTTNFSSAQMFYDSFSSLMEDTLEAWREQEQTVEFAAEDVDGWKQDEADMDKMLDEASSL